LIILSDSTSPNGKSKYLEYYFDNGGFGYSRVFWSVIPTTDTNSDLTKSLVPDGYKIIGWTTTNKLQLKSWTPYYNKSSNTELVTGMKLFGVEIVVNK